MGAEVYKKVNITGTQTVIDACVSHSVPKLVYTSSAGVVYSGEENLVDVDERMDFPQVPLDAYNATKAVAEDLVLKANGKDGLKTCAIRPAGIFGPGDRQALPGFVKVMENKQTKFQIGDNTNLFDWTYVGNVAHAHLLAADRLDKEISSYDFSYPLSEVSLSTGEFRVPTSKARPLGPQKQPTDAERAAAKAFDEPRDLTREDDLDLQPVLRTKMDQFSKAAAQTSVNDGDNNSTELSAVARVPNELAVAGQAFFITNCEPLYFWDFARSVWKGLGHIPPSPWVLSPSIGLTLASLAETFSRLTGREPGFTRFRVKFATQKRYYNAERARRLLAYEPVVGVEEGLKRTLEWWTATQAATNKVAAS